MNNYSTKDYRLNDWVYFSRLKSLKKIKTNSVKSKITDVFLRAINNLRNVDHFEFKLN